MCMGNVFLSVCLHSWKQNSRKVEVIFVHLLEWNSVSIQIPFGGSSLISNIFIFMRLSCLLKLTPWNLPCPVNLVWPRCSICHYHLFHWGWQSWGRVSLCDFNLQHSPVHIVHHTCACPKQGDRLHFGDMRCIMAVCPAAWQAEDHGVLVKHDNSTSTKPVSFSSMSSLEKG